MKSVLLCCLWSYAIQLTLYADTKNQIDHGRHQLKLTLIAINKADLKIEAILLDKEMCDCLIQLHLNSRPADAKASQHYVLRSVLFIYFNGLYKYFCKMFRILKSP